MFSSLCLSHLSWQLFHNFPPYAFLYSISHRCLNFPGMLIATTVDTTRLKGQVVNVFYSVFPKQTLPPRVKRLPGGFKENPELGDKGFAAVGSSPCTRLSCDSPRLKLRPTLALLLSFQPGS